MHIQSTLNQRSRTLGATGWLVIAATALLIADAAIAVSWWRPLNVDLRDYLLPWFDHLVRSGRFQGLADRFSNYNPPYLYVLGLGSLADGLFERTSIIRGLSVGFSAVAAVIVRRHALSVGYPRATAFMLAALFVLLPEIVLNGLLWGQCDIFYTAFLMLFVHLAAQDRGWAASAALGAALAFKLQAIFLGPFVLYLLLIGKIRWRQVLLAAPLAYLALLLPSALAGRPWADLLTIYLSQFDYYKTLSMGAPNPYWIVQRYWPDAFAIGSLIGLVVAAATAAAMTWAFVRRSAKPATADLYLMATTSLAVMPFVLPKMHERYFFPAAALAFMLAIARPQAWPVAVLLQLAALFNYAKFLLLGPGMLVTIALGFMTLALGAIALTYVMPLQSSSRAPLSRTGALALRV